MLNDTARRGLGAAFGALMGLGYGLVSIYINSLALPGLPLLQAGPPPPVSVLLITAAGALLGLLAAWPEDAIPGVIVSSLAGVLISSAASLLEVRDSPDALAQTFVGLFISLLPRAFLYIPISLLARWALNVWQNELQGVTFSTTKMSLAVAGIFGLSLLGGSFNLFPQEARLGLQDTFSLIERAQQAASEDELPPPLQAVDGFLQNGQGAFTLGVNNNPDRYPVQRPFAAYGVDEYAVTVRFENGFRFVCIYTPPNTNPVCGEY